MREIVAPIEDRRATARKNEMWPMLTGLLRRFMWRTAKRHVADQVNLPECTETVIQVTLTNEERVYYDAVRRELAAEVEYMRNGFGGGFYRLSRMTADIDRLRQLVSHPQLGDRKRLGTKLMAMDEILEKLRERHEASRVDALQTIANIKARMDKRNRSLGRDPGDVGEEESDAADVAADGKGERKGKAKGRGKAKGKSKAKGKGKARRATAAELVDAGGEERNGADDALEKALHAAERDLASASATLRFLESRLGKPSDAKKAKIARTSSTAAIVKRTMSFGGGVEEGACSSPSRAARPALAPPTPVAAEAPPMQRTGTLVLTDSDVNEAVTTPVGEVKDVGEKLMRTTTTLLDLGDEACSICLEPFEEAVITPCSHQFCRECLAGYHAARESRDQLACPECRAEFDVADVMAVLPDDGNEAATADAHVDIAEVYGAKTAALVEYIRGEKAKGYFKAVIFSAWVATLRHAREALTASGISSAAFIGNIHDRLAEVERFTEDSDVDVLLISMRNNSASGAAGLNLVQANACILLEPSLNFALEDQSIGRVYRIGQTRPTTVVRFVVDDTAESAIAARHEERRHVGGASGVVDHAEKLTEQLLYDILDIQANVMDEDEH